MLSLQELAQDDVRVGEEKKMGTILSSGRIQIAFKKCKRMFAGLK